MPKPRKRCRMRSGSTVTVTARPGVRRVIAGGQVFPTGQPVHDVPDKTIKTLEGMPGVTVDVAGQPDADTPEPPPPRSNRMPMFPYDVAELADGPVRCLFAPIAAALPREPGRRGRPDRPVRLPAPPERLG